MINSFCIELILSSVCYSAILQHEHHDHCMSIEHWTPNTEHFVHNTAYIPSVASEPKSLMNAYQIRIEKRFVLKNAIHPRRMRSHCNRTHKYNCMKMLLLLRLLLTSPTMHIINVTLPITSLALCSLPSDHCHDIPSYYSLPTIFFFTLGVFYSAVVIFFFSNGKNRIK